jgi:hypothetical protein
MALNAIKTTAGYVVEGTDQVDKQVEIFFDSSQTRHFDQLVEIEDSFFKNQEFKEKRAALPDPERDLYLTIFGAGDEDPDKVLHTTLVDVQEARDGISLDWSKNNVTVVLRLITQGEGNRLRLIGDRLVDMGPVVAVPAPVEV